MKSDAESGCQGLGGGGNGKFLFNGSRVSVWQDEKLWMDGGNGSTTV